MVLRLAGALSMPKDAVNQALNAAGFAPAFPAHELDAAALGPIRRAVDMMLARHDPFPGVAIDRHWNIFAANGGATKLFLQNAALTPSDHTPNLIDAFIAADGAGLIENWSEIAALTVTRRRGEVVALGGDEQLSNRIEILQGLLRRRNQGGETFDCSRAVIPTVFNVDGARLTLFATIASFSTVQDVGASDIRIELMFPENKTTQAFFEN